LDTLTATQLKPLDFFLKNLHPSFGLGKGLSERLATAPFTDELDEIREPTFFRIQLRRPYADGFRNVGIELPHLFLATLENVAKRFRFGEPLLDGGPARGSVSCRPPGQSYAEGFAVRELP